MGTNLVNGRWFDPDTSRKVFNPADGTLVGEIGYCDAHIAVEAVNAAESAAKGWAAVPAPKRAEFLRRAAESIHDRADELGELLAREAGKRLPEAVGEIRGAAEYFRWFANEACQPHGTVYTHGDQGRRHISIRRPAGVVASLTPWNFPCSIQARKLAPALAAGCTVVARVSEKAPLAVTEMVRCLVECGLPPGTVNLVHGPAKEITEAYLSHNAVRVVSFTGSTEIGQQIMQLASKHVVRPLLELGGTAPFIVFDDADVQSAINGFMEAKFRNTGQSCIGANKLYVQNSIYDSFTSDLAGRISSMTVGNGLDDPTPDLGPCIDSHRVEELSQLIREAEDSGGRMLNAPVRVPSSGNYCPPALIANASPHCALAREEVFGPIVLVVPFETEEEVFDEANATDYGLAGYVYTKDLDRAWRAAETLDVGVIGINDSVPTVPFAPMGGVKKSGLGREGSDVGLEEYQEFVYIALRVEE